MVFTSLHFVVFFAVVYALYRVLPHRWQNVMLLAAQLLLLWLVGLALPQPALGSTIVDYLVGRCLA